MKRAFSFNPSVAKVFFNNAVYPGTDIFSTIFLRNFLLYHGKKDSSNFTKISFAKIQLITSISYNFKVV